MSKPTINYFIGGAIITTAAAIGAMLVIVPHTQKIQIQAKPVAVAQSADPHAGHNMPRMSETTSPEIELAKAKLSITGKLVPKRPVTMTIDIQDLKGESIDKFDTFQEKLMHLIVVSNDLTEFAHLHPTYQQKGKFVVSANFPTSGKYTLFSDYKPTGIAEQVSVLTTEIQGKVMPPESPSFKSSKTIGSTEASLEIEAQKVTTGKNGAT